MPAVLKFPRSWSAQTLGNHRTVELRASVPDSRPGDTKAALSHALVTGKISKVANHVFQKCDADESGFLELNNGEYSVFVLEFCWAIGLVVPDASTLYDMYKTLDDHGTGLNCHQAVQLAIAFCNRVLGRKSRIFDAEFHPKSPERQAVKAIQPRHFERLRAQVQRNSPGAPDQVADASEATNGLKQNLLSSASAGSLCEQSVKVRTLGFQAEVHKEAATIHVTSDLDCTNIAVVAKQPNKQHELDFHEKVNEVDAASETTVGPERNIKDQSKIPFVQRRQWCNLDSTADVEEVAAASAATVGLQESSAHQIQTPSQQPKHERNLDFHANMEEVASVSEAAAGQKGNIRDEVINPVEEPKEERSIDFQKNVSEVAASEVTVGLEANFMDRCQAQFEQPRENNLDLHVNLEEVAPASEAAAGLNGSGLDRNVNLSQQQQEERSCEFHAVVEEVAASSQAVVGPKRSIRDRINTGYLRFEDDLNLGFCIGFETSKEEVYAASEAKSTPKNIRDRIITPFEFEQKSKSDEHNVSFAGVSPRSKRVSVSFGLEVEQQKHEYSSDLQTNVATETLASVVTPGLKGNSVDRIDTTFEQPKEESNFDVHANAEGAASSEATIGVNRNIRDRVETGFEQPQEERNPDFQTNVDGVPAASEATTGLKMDIENRRRSSCTTLEEYGSVMTFSDYVEELEAASEATVGVGRSIRGRLNTGFSHGEEDEEQPSLRRMSMGEYLNARGSTPRASLGTLSDKRLSLTMGPQERRAFQHSHIGIGLDLLPDDSPEAELDDHEIEDAEKDTDLIHNSLSGFVLFEDAEEQVIQEFIEAMSVFEFEDQQQVIRQGDAGGTYFFIVAHGQFEVVKDGTVVKKLARGASFGESVLLIDGQRTATVRAKGKARVYGMEADDVRDMLRFQHEMRNPDVISTVDKIVESGKCDAVHNKLNTFQLNELYKNAHVQTFEHGESIFVKGQVQMREVYVLVQGAVILRKDDVDLGRVKSYNMFGLAGCVHCSPATVSAVVDGMAKTLTIGKSVLEAVFGTEAMPATLLRARVRECLGRIRELNHIDEQQHDALVSAARIVSLLPGEELDTEGVRFVMAMHHEVEVSTDGFHADVRKLAGATYGSIGTDHLLNRELQWTTQVRGVVGDLNSMVAVLYLEDVSNALIPDEKKAMLSILTMVPLFQTLPKLALQTLAQNMQHEKFGRSEAIIKQGDLGDTFYLIGSGRVEIEKNDRFIRSLTQGDFFGERSLLTREPRSASIIAIENCVIWKMTKEIFNQMMPAAMIDYLKVRMTLQDKEFTFDDLMVSRTIGTGGFGIVRMVHAKDGSRYALKRVQKQTIISNGQQETVINERSILSDIDHPFIVRLVQTFRNEAFLYLLMELVTGGDLLDALSRLGILNHTQSRFYTASILLALECLHERRIAYLDLKSENILLDHQGYIKIVDFGLAVRIRGGHGGAIKGTPHFMSPEMILSKAYDTTADLWSLGICVYEFMVGELPFGQELHTTSGIFNAILKNPLVFPERFQNRRWYEQSRSLITGLLQRTPTKRLGAGIGGYTELYAHTFFSNFDWDGLMTRKLAPPYTPEGELYMEKEDESGSLGKRPLAEIERRAVAEELKRGWFDPDPGWDDEFES